MKYDDNIEGRVTLDLPMKSGNTANSDWNTVVKFAYLDLKQLMPNDSFIRLGVQPVYFSMIDKWDYLFIEKSLEDVCGLLNSADLGVSLQGSLPWVTGDYQIAAYNGNGSAKACETDNNAAANFSASITLLPGLSIRESLYTANISSGDAYAREGIYAEKYFAATSLNYYFGPFWLMGELIDGKKPNSTYSDYTNITANSMLLMYTFNDQVQLGARQDIYDPDIDKPSTNTSDSRQTRTIFGINYKCFKDILAQLNFEELSYEGGRDARTDTKPRTVDDYVILQLKWSY
jgi:hypothetical protein